MSGSDQISLRFKYTAESSNSRGAGALSVASASAGLDNVDRAVSASNTTTLTPRIVNEARGQFAYGNLRALPTDPVGPAVSIAGTASFGTLSGSPPGRMNKAFQVADNLSYHRTAHALRVGADVLFNADRITFSRANRGSYTFSSLASFLSGVYNNAGFSRTFGAPVVEQHNPNVGLFVQDEWRASPSLALNAGLRYGLLFLETIRTDVNNVSPRVGLA